MGRIEKTVFISYRRTNLPWALFIYQNLTMHGYDVFFDYQSIDSGNFETVILDNIRARAHFLVVLTPSALENCKNPGDWLRREIETAMDENRNIVPLMVENFDFGSPLVKEALSGKLSKLNTYNGLPIPNAYALEAMKRLRERYLNVALSDVATSALHAEAQKITENQKVAASEAAPVENEQLTAQTWYERGYVFEQDGNFDEAIRCLTEAINSEPSFASAYSLRGDVFRAKGQLDLALEDHNMAVKLNPNRMAYFGLRGLAREEKGDYVGAIEDYTEGIRLEDNAAIYSLRGFAYDERGDLDKAMNDLEKAIKLDPDNPDRYLHRGDIWEKKFDYNKAISDYQKFLELGGEEQDGDGKVVKKKIKQLKNNLAKKKSSGKKAS